MPIALSALFTTFNGGVKKIESLSDAMERGATVLARQRGAFLTSWFGDLVPTEGLAIKAYIVNSDAIFARIQHARTLQADNRRQELMPNLIEPLMGTGGMLVGSVIGGAATLGALSSAVVLTEAAGASAGLSAVMVIVGLSMGAMLGIVAALMGLYRMYSLYSWGFEDGAPESHYNAGYYSDLVDMGRDYAGQVQGAIGSGQDLIADRSDVQDPVRRALLTLLDRSAALMTRALAPLAIFLPVIRAMRPLISPIQDLLLTFKDMAMAVVTSFMEMNPMGALRPILAKLAGLIPSMDELSKLKIVVFSAIEDGLKTVFMPMEFVGRSLENVWSTKAQELSEWIKSFSVVAMFTNIRDLAGPLRSMASLLGTVLRRIVPNVTPQPIAAVGGLVAAALSRFQGSGSSANTATPSIPQAPPQSSFNTSTLTSVLPSPPPVLSPTMFSIAEAVSEIQIDDLPMHVVGSIPRLVGNQIAAERRRGRAALTDPHTVQATAMVHNAARLAGFDAQVEQAWGYLADLEGPLGEVPVHDVPQPRRIIPVIGTLRVQSTPGHTSEDLDSWARDLPAQIGSQPVPIPSDSRY